MKSWGIKQQEKEDGEGSFLTTRMREVGLIFLQAELKKVGLKAVRLAVVGLLKKFPSTSSTQEKIWDGSPLWSYPAVLYSRTSPQKHEFWV